MREREDKVSPDCTMRGIQLTGICPQDASTATAVNSGVGGGTAVFVAGTVGVSDGKGMAGRGV